VELRIVITGSWRGLGRGIARELAHLGHRVWLNGRHADALDASFGELEGEFGDRAAGRTIADIRVPAQIEALWTHAHEAMGGVDVWINNAGVATSHPPGPALQAPLADLRAPIEINLLGTLNCLHIVGRRMQESGGGTVYVLEGFGSDGKRLQTGLAGYGASKAGLSYLMRALRAEWKDTPLRMGRISPGMVVTRLLLAPYGESGPPPEARRAFEIFADRVETVAPFIAQAVTRGELDIVWLTPMKILGRLALAPFRTRKVLESN
jgi:NAD(P)-dependent dehydrogenase (short-subunit alcohol dehydrogenase family)